MMTGRLYGALGMAGVGASLLALIALHVLDPDRSVVDETISEYALGDYGWLVSVNDIVLGVGITAIALGLRQTLAPGKRVTAAWVFLLIVGLGFLIAAVFETDPRGAAESTTSGAIHGTAALVSVLGLAIAAWLLRGVFTRDASYLHLARTQLWFAVLITLGVVVLVVLFEAGPAGLIQRLLVVVMASWLFVLAANLRHVETTRYATGRNAA
jgi:hypothetical protein